MTHEAPFYGFSLEHHVPNITCCGGSTVSSTCPEVRAHLAPATHQRFFLPQIVMGSDIKQFILDPRDCLSQLQNAS